MNSSCSLGIALSDGEEGLISDGSNAESYHIRNNWCIGKACLVIHVASRSRSSLVEELMCEIDVPSSLPEIAGLLRREIARRAPPKLRIQCTDWNKPKNNLI